ncbi:glycosyl hydrolase family 61-domain-containing protein [Apiosordaria backusii]|uniref:lytic cellulose monooxygenase (C4-dehydrogenating) n=1 Tax=Apiosordaria backusii TaxID=314023 RepID=A0AA40EMP7_9PEZI|nr:glycosyl hydrolase family 61-domain-containing protein [Apiosordaria backusii]
MRSKILFTAGLATTFASLATAHTVLTTVFVNGVNQGDGTCIRMSTNPDRATFPIEGINSPNMACGLEGANPVAFTCPAPAGSTLTFAFREWADEPTKGAGPIDPSHIGSIAIYLKQVSNISTSSPSGGGWFKIYSSGYDSGSKEWSARKLIADKGLLSFSLPSGLPTGYYLARSEILAIHDVSGSGPQFFVNCAQLFVSGSTSGSLSIPSDKSVSIPGYLSSSDPGLTYNIYESNPDSKPYTIVGPASFRPGGAGPSTNAKQTDGVIPSGCILKNANWCAREVPDYTNENECWKASDDCWAQLDVCYKTAPPSGSRGCRVWQEKKCDVIVEACRSGEWKGPRNKGQKVGSEGESSAPVPGRVPGVGAGPEPVDEPVKVDPPVQGGDDYGNGGGGEGSGEEEDDDDVDVDVPAPTTRGAVVVPPVPTTLVTRPASPVTTEEVVAAPVTTAPPVQGGGPGGKKGCKKGKKNYKRRLGRD